MSGGHFNYDNNYIGSVAEDILSQAHEWQKPRVDKYGDRQDALPKDFTDAMFAIGKRLKILDQAVHDLDFYLSGDHGDDSFRERMIKWRKKI